MNSAKDIALIGVYTALLIGCQLALTALSGVELVTSLLLSFAYVFGVRRGLCVANAFSFLRCFVFGFFPPVIILYLIYYNLFVVVFGLLPRVLEKGQAQYRIAATSLIACAMTILFTVLDDIITPVFYGFSFAAAKAYAIMSLTAVVPQVACTAITVTFLSPALISVFKRQNFLKKG